jgi:hypothetical protein
VFCYFFKGNQYIRVTRGRTGPGNPPIDNGYPQTISVWNWGTFGANGIDAALFSGSKCYFFAGSSYIRVSRSDIGPGTVDAGYPAPISNWGWGSFGSSGIEAALWLGPKCYFFKGTEYIRVSREETGPGTVDKGYPRPISNWNWGAFGANGINAALFSETALYFFSGSQYIRYTLNVSADDPNNRDTFDAGYPQQISSSWGWGNFGRDGIDAALYSGEPGNFLSWDDGIATVNGIDLNGLLYGDV